MIQFDMKCNRNMITCPNCGAITKDEIQIYNENLRKQSFGMSPISPLCKHCGADVINTNKCNGGSIIVLNGASGSGKSTIAEILSGKGFLVIDGDCAIQVIKHKKNSNKWDFTELAEEISCEIDILSLFGDNFVLANVILPDDLNKYIDIFESRNIAYKLFLLRPEYRIAVERCQTRTCHTSATPEYWIKHFYDLLNFDNRVAVIDNTDKTPEETAAQILALSECQRMNANSLNASPVNDCIAKNTESY